MNRISIIVYQICEHYYTLYFIYIIMVILTLFLFFFFFFFSSRRRHTRLTCDWSSDVCSSDLAAGNRDQCDHAEEHASSVLHVTGLASRERVALRDFPTTGWIFGSDRQLRSEERRVGKECRSRWSEDH